MTNEPMTNEVISKPCKHGVQASQVKEAFEEIAVEFPARDQAAEIVKPTDTALDSIAALIAPECPPVLPRWPSAIAPVRTNQFNPAALESVAKPVGVGRPIVQQASRFARQLSFVDQRLDRVDFIMMGGRRIGRQGCPFAINHQEDARAVSLVAAADLVTPFFARMKVASASSSSKSNSPRSSSCWMRRA